MCNRMCEPPPSDRYHLLTGGPLQNISSRPVLRWQGPASGKELLPLPAHKFGPHDIVAVRPSRGGPPLAQGVVYRLHEASIVVAVDDAPDDGLEQPLRLEKLANTVGVAAVALPGACAPGPVHQAYTAVHQDYTAVYQDFRAVHRACTATSAQARRPQPQPGGRVPCPGRR